ncbi:FAD-dependent monooxygenase [Umezawaea tangerina]|uniref:2-polyprenyl-6-methoxyphenol hydroxylase-like FAD-dependent oxidoreductase n=1 Tax=Umezawaea tangerina TaxID=84725 RepID=A0A2T0SXI8_9PSEU|nr:FAD-dependent monooxygenase [Umezawaea tangerina]PRY38136.1 2-polyprenyl-6-methoxyphenol hydroxylase-like FAD-dependent oxidoreductase [Umezawaea tangerina]
MDVVVIGAGPTGLVLAHELALGGAEVVVVERLAERVRQVKGGAIQPRTSELLDARGLLEAIQERALERTNAGGHFAGLPVSLDCEGWQTRHPYPIAVPQWAIEDVLAEAAVARGVAIMRDHAVTAVEQDDDGVTVTAGGVELRAAYAVACDGAHSAVRKLLELPFPGRPGTYRAVLTDVRLTAVSELVPTTAGHLSTMTRHDNGYFGMLVPVGGDEYRFTYGATSTEEEAKATPEGVQRALTAVYGEGTVLGEVLNSSWFSDATRQLEHYRHGRVLFAGDSAHIHPPWGGQGLNLGVQDAVNLGWKLAATTAGWAPEGLLDTYQVERHPKAARVLHHTSAQRLLATPKPDEDLVALREIFTDLIRLPDANHHLAGMMSGLDAEGRVPDHDLVTEDGPVRLAELLRTGRGLLLDPTGSLDVPEGWADRVDVVRVKSADDLGPLLLRPDTTVCWSGEGSLADALTTTFGRAA